MVHSLESWEDFFVNWAEPELANYSAVTEYRVEERCDETGEWKEDGRISAKLDRRMKIYENESHIHRIRVIVMNKMVNQ